MTLLGICHYDISKTYCTISQPYVTIMVARKTKKVKLQTCSICCYLLATCRFPYFIVKVSYNILQHPTSLLIHIYFSSFIISWMKVRCKHIHCHQCFSEIGNIFFSLTTFYIPFGRCFYVHQVKYAYYQYVCSLVSKPMSKLSRASGFV